MSDDNKKNLIYFESASMKGLYTKMEKWQETNQKRLMSTHVQKDKGKFCCIALSNPMEVVITDRPGIRSVDVSTDGCLFVK